MRRTLFLLSSLAMLLFLLGASVQRVQAINLFDSVLSVKPWVRASALTIRDKPTRAAFTAGIGMPVLDKKTSLTIQYKVVVEDANQFEIGVTRALW